MAVVQLDFPEESLESEFLDQSLSVWKGRCSSPCYGLDDFTPVPLDLHTACSIGHSNIVRLIIDSQKESLDCANKGGWTALMYASYIGHEPVVQQLLEAGVSVNCTNSKGQCPLALATSCGNDKTAELLIKQGANIEARDKKGWTPLFYATYSGHQNMVQLLVAHGADVNAVEHLHGLTPLMEASAAGHANTVQFFLQHGANVYAKSRSGATALTEAAANGHTEVVNILNRHMLSAKIHLGASITEGPKAFAWLMDQIDDNSDVPISTVGDLLSRLSDAEMNSCTERNVQSADVSVQDAGSVVSRVVVDNDDDDDDDDDSAFTHSGALTIKSSRQSPNASFTNVGHVTESSSSTDRLQSTEDPRFEPDVRDADKITPGGIGNHSLNRAHTGHCRQLTALPEDNRMKSKTTATYDLRTFLTELGLVKYADIFCEQDVDLTMFLTLNEDDLKEIGIRLFGPRRKMITAISQWNAARSHEAETSKPDTALSYQAGDELERTRNQLQQERQLRAVTEACLMEDRVAWQQVSAVVTKTLRHCSVLHDGLSCMSSRSVSLLHRTQHSNDRGNYNSCSRLTVQQVAEQLQTTCSDLLRTVNDIAASMHGLTRNSASSDDRQLIMSRHPP